MVWADYWLTDHRARTETGHPTISHVWAVGRTRILHFPQHWIDIVWNRCTAARFLAIFSKCSSISVCSTILDMRVALLNTYMYILCLLSRHTDQCYEKQTKPENLVLLSVVLLIHTTTPKAVIKSKESGACLSKAYDITIQRYHKSHTKIKLVKYIFCSVWVQNFVWNFNGVLWNFTQHFEPIHCKICILWGVKNFFFMTS